MRKKILCFAGLAALIFGLILFAVTASGAGPGPHHLNWLTLGPPAILVVGGLIVFVLNLDCED